jgi:hypothetical protein
MMLLVLERTGKGREAEGVCCRLHAFNFMAVVVKRQHSKGDSMEKVVINKGPFPPNDGKHCTNGGGTHVYCRGRPSCLPWYRRFWWRTRTALRDFFSSGVWLLG